jgi:hypothetical protein
MGGTGATAKSKTLRNFPNGVEEKRKHTMLQLKAAGLIGCSSGEGTDAELQTMGRALLS